MASASAPIFSAVSNSARQLYLLLRCLAFAKKVTVQIMADGLRFSAEDSRIMQGLIHIDKALFTSFAFTSPHQLSSPSANDYDPEPPTFQISLQALLETLQIFGGSEGNVPFQSSTQISNTPANAAFTTPVLSLSGSCRITYPSLGSPLNITLVENNCTTTCSLTTYLPSDTHLTSSPSDIIAEEIPLDKNALTMKIIMRSTWLSDAITELATTDPTILSLSASATRPPFFALGAQGGPFSDSVVEFDIDKNSNIAKAGRMSTGTNQPSQFLRQTRLAPAVTETFQIKPPLNEDGKRSHRVTSRYRFNLIQKAARAMQIAEKVSIRADENGVLSLQFMVVTGGPAKVENATGDEGGNNVVAAGGGQGKVSFVDFRFVPLLDEDEDEDEDAEEDGEDTEGDEGSDGEEAE